jgi:hypothetical protein
MKKINRTYVAMSKFVEGERTMDATRAAVSHQLDPASVETGIRITSFVMFAVTTAALGFIGIGLAGLALFILSHVGSAEWERMVICAPLSLGLGGLAVAIAARMWTIPK